VKISLRHLEVFSDAMAKCLSSGLSAGRSLELAGLGSASKPLRAATMLARQRIDQGSTLGDALEKNERDFFPPFFVPVVQCGEEGGRTPEAFEYLSDYCRKLIPTQDVVRKTWRYPVSILLFGWAIMICLCLIFGATSMAWMLFRTTFVRYGIIAVIVYLLLRVRTIRTLFETIRLQILLWREVELGLASATFLKAFSLTYKTSGLPAARMAELSCRTIGNSVIRRDFLQVRDALQSGMAFEDAFARPRMLKDVYKNEIATASISGRLDECLDRLARQSAEDVEVWLNRFNGVAHRVVFYSVLLSIYLVAFYLAKTYQG